MIRRTLALLALMAIPLACGSGDTPVGDSLVLAGARVYPAPSAPAIDDAVVHVSGDTIVYVGSRAGFATPPGATVVDCSGQVVTAGFWNSHAHFVEARWSEAASAPASVLAAELERTFLRHGFTTVFDVGSPWPVASALRQRTASGEVTGPRILTVGPIVFPRGGAPPRVMTGALGLALDDMPEIADPDDATTVARGLVDGGADGLKLYVATWYNDPPVRMPPDVAAAVAQVGRERGRPIFAHPSDATGVETALAAGVTVLTHTIPAAGGWNEAIVSRLVDAGVAVTPTLTLWRVELERVGAPADAVRAVQQVAVNELRRFARAGGQVLFGTDVGYIDHDDPAEEYRLMGEAGMDAQQILASLTTSPAARFGHGERSGRVAAGYRADLVVLGEDPARDVTAFAAVASVVKAGRLVFPSREH